MESPDTFDPRPVPPPPPPPPRPPSEAARPLDKIIIPPAGTRLPALERISFRD